VGRDIRSFLAIAAPVCPAFTSFLTSVRVASVIKARLRVFRAFLDLRFRDKKTLVWIGVTPIRFGRK